jgi:FkbM family methyltransferase
VSLTLTERDPIWIFGCGSYGRDVARAFVAEGFDVAGFIESKPRASVIDGLPIRAVDSLLQRDFSGQLAVGIFNREASYLRLIRDYGLDRFKRLQLPWDTYVQLGHRLGWRYWLNDPSILKDYRHRLEKVVDGLADSTSRDTLNRIFRFRLGEDLAYSDFRHQESQYFNSLSRIPRASAGWFVDGGAYDGDSYAQFLALMGKPEAAVLFEPGIESYLALVSRDVVRANAVLCLPLALSDGPRQLRFSASSGEAAAIDSRGETVIQAVALDDICHGLRVGFIKLDVEGAERDAIRGAQRIIRTNRPVIAMSLYHRFDDIWVLPELLCDYCEDYSFHIRQHYFNSFDCVLYAIPKEVANMI